MFCVSLINYIFSNISINYISHHIWGNISGTIFHCCNKELDIYNQTGRIGFHEGVIQKVEGVVNNNYKKEVTFKLFENANYYYTDGSGQFQQ